MLEGGVNPHFFGTPIAFLAGRAMELDAAKDVADACSEIIHVPMDYQVKHVHKIGSLSWPLAPLDFRTVRNRHLERLRGEPGGTGFGREMM